MPGDGLVNASRGALKACSVLLQYPTERTFAVLDDVEAVAAALPARRGGRSLHRVVGWLRATPPAVVAETYVDTFDFDRRASLYLSYYVHGDTRDRGGALLALRGAYRAAGYRMTGDELPDYLPVMLELAALGDTGLTVLGEHRAALEVLRTTLRAAESPYADLLDVVGTQLPRAPRRVLAAAHRMLRDGPPSEQVGLEPYMMPEVRDGAGGCP